MNWYERLYDNIIELQAELEDQEKNSAEWDHRGRAALAATYSLQDYLANKIAEIGESPEGED